MAFRDDLEAAQARGAALEQKVAELEAENRALRGEPEDSDQKLDALELGRGKGALPLAAAGGVAVVGAVVAVSVDYPPVAVAFGGLALAFLTFAVALRNLLVIVPIGGVAVISGRRRQVAGGESRGYRLVHGGGRVMLIPIIEHVELLDVRPRRVEPTLNGAYTSDNIPTNVTLVATIAINKYEPTVDNAIERFLGRDGRELERVASETIEGAARAVMANHSKVELDKDREAFASELIEEAEPELRKLGLTIENLAVSRVASEV